MIGAFLVTLIALAVLVPQARSADFGGKVKIAAVQTDPVFQDKEGNLADMTARALDAAAEGADLIVFPELSLTGYKYRSRAEMKPDAEPVPGPSTYAMAEVAEAADAYIAFGMVESDGDALYDAVVLVGPDGYVGKYAKITMGHQSEAVLFTRGPAAPPVFETSIGRIGLASCYDGAFPENARLLGLGGAQILVLIDTENGSTWRDYVRARAVENGAFAVVANRVGTERNSTFNGYSLIADPAYNLLANAGTTEVETIYATVDLSDVDRTFLSQRRPELYRAVTKPMTPAVLGLDAEPWSSVAGTETPVDVSLSTTALPAGTPVSGRIVDSGGATIASATGTLGVDQGVLSMTVPAAAPVGVGELEVTVGESTKSMRFTVKDEPKPGVLGTSPTTAASTASSLYVGFDSELVPSTSVPITLTAGSEEFNLTGKVNQTVIDDRVVAPYTGLAPSTTYTATIPADAVEGAGTGAGNDAYSFTFTTAEPAVNVVGAVAQLETTPLDKTANVAATIAQMQAADAAGVELLVFPELSTTGAEFADRGEAEAVAESLAGGSVEAIAAEAAALDMTVVVGLVESAGQKLYDTSVLIGPDGVIGSHRSTQLSDEQVGIFDAGDTVSPVFDTEAGPIGLISGYENYFPEVTRSLSIRGALIVAGGYAEEGTIWRELARTRGSENKIYMLAANQSTAGGRSLIARTSRGIVTEMADASAGFAKGALDLTGIANRYYTYVDQSTDKARTTHYYLDRRPEIYAPISARSSSATSLALDRAKVTVGGEGLTATVTVAGTEDAAPAGTVVLSSDGGVLGEAPVEAGSATFVVPAAKLAPGTETLTATYVGSEDLTESSDRAAVTVEEAAASLAASLRSTTVVAGKGSVVEVGVTAFGLPTVSGTVAVTVAGRTVEAPLGDGAASLPLAAMTKAGSFPVAVRYLGDDPLVGAAEETLMLTVRKARPRLSVRFSKRTVKSGARAKAKVRISAPGLPGPGGKLTVKAGGRSATFAVRNGVARVSVPTIRRTGKVKVSFAFRGSAALKSATKRAMIAVRP
jgi:predicted amidohydrolase